MSKSFFMVAPHSRTISGNDKIFAVNNAAQAMAKKIGSNHVVNASIGALMDDEGNLSILSTVIDILRSLPSEEFAAYAPIAGLPSFLEAVKKAAFKEFVPKGYIEAVATPGGSGAIRHTIRNYSKEGDDILTSDWYWGPYHTIAEEHNRNLKTYTLFDKNDKFHLSSFTEKVNAILEKQRNLVILLNSPAHNPTGYSLSDEEWKNVIDVLKTAAKNKDKKIILFVDLAYIDFAGENSRSFMKYFNNLPENILIIIGFSMSKGYTLYGMRSGAMIGISSNEEVAKEFKQINSFSNRGVWSNGTRPAMVVLTKIFENKELLEKVEAERKKLHDMLNERANAFLEEAKRVGLKVCPYKAGFFITIPCDDPERVCEELTKDAVFAVPLKKGIRFAVCSVSKEKCSKAPEKFVKAIKAVKK
ncbi:pyridoxal phosphate-dependent aminotransferase [Crassaminicella indica]|uniref:Aminotransferase class I/II-fold pyridoxal phosphate-dependent enzyme n=1 Tax=Crassaminicella indica TaxID=2855394 RepID=A0ABX8RFV6_9CLOT|nr:aminotransferase class I/II-fold pyridoxal phosphate-dependent enzyme [Crassaminicella indica]QXM07207.1 aminotransferase class I/II-fold pyridoxal phosphate-dependent enzyme [Crassaminicella indica]